jgi:hypothetical protein
MNFASTANRVSVFIDIAAKFENGIGSEESSGAKGNAPNMQPADQHDLHVPERIEKSA